MPIYEYTCRNCGEDFDLLRSVKDNDRDVECPYCKEKEAERRISLSVSASQAIKDANLGRHSGGCTRFG